MHGGPGRRSPVRHLDLWLVPLDTLYTGAYNTGMTTTQDTERNAKYRQEVRKTFQMMSDQALAFQSARIVGGIDREEVDREINRRRYGK